MTECRYALCVYSLLCCYTPLTREHVVSVRVSLYTGLYLVCYYYNWEFHSQSYFIYHLVSMPPFPPMTTEKNPKHNDTDKKIINTKTTNRQANRQQRWNALLEQHQTLIYYRRSLSLPALSQSLSFSMLFISILSLLKLPLSYYHPSFTKLFL
mgnify:FL=1